MKNIQVIDAAMNCTFSIFQATDDEFALIFPEPGQDVQYAEDIADLPRQELVNAAVSAIWERPIRKRDAAGIHGTLFYQLERYRRFIAKSGKKQSIVLRSTPLNAACLGSNEGSLILFVRRFRRLTQIENQAFIFERRGAEIQENCFLQTRSLEVIDRLGIVGC